MVMGFLGGIASNIIGEKIMNAHPRMTRGQELLNDGSQNYPYSAPVIVAGTVLWIDIATEFPQARTYFPLDFAEIINNSAQPITVYLNSRSESRLVPSYMIKPFRQPLRQIGLENIGVDDTVAGDILINLRRLPPDIQITANVGTAR